MNEVSANQYSEFERKQLGLNVALVSFLMLFAALFLSYAVFRSQQTTWPPFGFEELNLLWPSLGVASVLLSSFTLVQFRNRQSKFFYFMTFFLGLSFLASQLKLWAHLKEIGFFVGSGIFSSIVYGFTWIHAAHMVFGVIGILCLFPSTKNNFNNFNTYKFRIKAVESFWHLLGAIWVLMFVGFFLV